MFRRILMLAVCGLVLGSLAPAPAQAQFGKLKDKLKQRAEEKVDKKVDCTLDKYIDKKECAAEKAAKSANGGDGAAAGSAATKGSANPTSKPGQGAWANFDFVPGARPIFVEDFSRDRVGNFPKRLELDGGTYEIVEWEGARWLSGATDGNYHITLPEALPERWTMEFDVTIPWWGMYVFPGAYEGYEPNTNALQGIRLGIPSVVANGKGNTTEFDPRTLLGTNIFSVCKENCSEDDIARSAATWEDTNLTPPVRIRIHADGAYMKVYLNEKRVANMPNMGRWQTKQINFYTRENTAGGNPAPILISNFSINAGGREMYDALMADGRLAVQGIYFDTGSDRIRPESSGTLAEIADMLNEHTDLKLTIEGHTDNTGDAAANQTLSEKRAAAVVTALAGAPYKVGADRFKSVGFGPSKPARPNDTPEGRQANRRVELVVQK
ncbi:MAG: OmpA family protein [Gemmatimonadota bacterium]